VRVAQRETPAADPGDPATQDMEFLPRYSLGRVGQEGELDVRHLPMLSAHPTRRRVRMGVTENVATVRRFYAAGPADDDADRSRFASPDIVWHVPGGNRISGEYRGADAVFRAMPAAMQPLDAWEIEVVDVMGNADLVVATVRVRGARYGLAVETDGAHVFRLDADARIVEAWGFTVRQTELDAMLDPV
jgi:ketosteroid isomerase-like protein